MPSSVRLIIARVLIHFPVLTVHVNNFTLRRAGLRLCRLEHSARSKQSRKSGQQKSMYWRERERQRDRDRQMTTGTASALLHYESASLSGSWKTTSFPLSYSFSARLFEPDTDLSRSPSFSFAHSSTFSLFFNFVISFDSTSPP